MSEKKENFISKYSDIMAFLGRMTITIGAIAGAMIWLNSEFKEVERNISSIRSDISTLKTDIAIIKTVLIMKNIYPEQLTTEGE